MNYLMKHLKTKEVTLDLFAELQDAGKSKDSANKRCLQKLEHSQQDLLDANKKITELEDELRKLKDAK